MHNWIVSNNYSYLMITIIMIIMDTSSDKLNLTREDLDLAKKGKP